MSFTWFNVNPSYNNQKIAYSLNNGTSFQDLTFPAGVWNYSDLNAYIKQITGNDDMSLNFQFNNIQS